MADYDVVQQALEGVEPWLTASTGRLLVVDDNKVNRLLLGRSLEQQGHTR